MNGLYSPWTELFLIGIVLLIGLLVLMLRSIRARSGSVTTTTQEANTTGTGSAGSSSTSSSTSISSKIWSWWWYVFLGGLALLLWWQWDWVVGLWETDDWLGQLWSVVLAIHALEPADVLPLALIAFLALAVIGVFFIIKSGDTDAMKDALPWVALIIICVMILFFASR